LTTSGQVREPLNPFTIPEVVAGYEAWYETTGRRADRLEKALLRRLIAEFPEALTILEVGCGTGHFARWFSAQGTVRDGSNLEAVGLDLSPLMLSLAVLLGSPPCVRADALALPFPVRVFDLVALITTLEFLPDPLQALVEALRVAKQGLILGVLNRSSLLGRWLKRKGGPVWDASRFFTPAELIHLAENAVSGQLAAIVWRTTLWPIWPGSLPLPWGGFVGVAVKLL
jgi:ubiquinone/menaquinone biosynthesis C-methylase UbiE